MVSQTQMLDSLDLFERTIQLDELKFSPIVLLLNQIDLLAQLMRDDPIEHYFPEYSGDSDPLAACRFFAAKFLDLDSRPEGNLRVVIASAVDPYDLNCTIGELIPEVFKEEPAIIPAKEEEYLPCNEMASVKVEVDKFRGVIEGGK